MVESWILGYAVGLAIGLFVGVLIGKNVKKEKFTKDRRKRLKMILLAGIVILFAVNLLMFYIV